MTQSTDKHFSQALDAPIFVVGPLRSGSTLLRVILNHHPDTNVFSEFEIAVNQAQGNHWPTVEEYKTFLRSDRQFAALNLTIDEALDYEALVKSFLEQLHLRKPRKILGASVHSRMDLLPKLWPNAKFIHILRDPRDVAKSCIGMGWVGNVHEGAEYWIKAEKHWELLEAAVPSEQTYTVRYEELVSNPDAEVAKICEFLGLDYRPEMLDIGKDTTYSRPDAGFAYQWKRRLSAQEIGHVEYQCHEMMSERGYEVVSDPVKPPSLFEKLGIILQSRWYRIGFNVERWGLKLWLMYTLCKHLGLRSLQERYQLQINEIATRYLK